MKLKSKKAIKKPMEDRVFNAVTIGVVSFMTLIVLLPMMNIVASSFSEPSAVKNNQMCTCNLDVASDHICLKGKGEHL